MLRFLLTLLVSVLAACVQPPRDMSNGVLKDDWYVKPSDGNTFFRAQIHMCKYENGVVVNAGPGKPCP